MGKMSEEKHHEQLVKGFSEQMKTILDNSAQPVLLYLDDRHKSCNKKFATMMGYPSPKAFNDTDVNFVETFIDKKSQAKVVMNYAVFSEKLVASTFSATFKKKSGKSAKATVIHVPVTFEGHLFAVLFVL